METALYILGGFFAVVIIAQLIFGKEKVQRVGEGMQKAGCAMTIFLSVPIVVSFIFPPVGIPLLIIGIIAAISYAAEAGKE